MTKAISQVTALELTMQDQAAEILERHDPITFKAIKKGIESDGWDPEKADRFVELTLGFREGSKLRMLCLNAARSLYRKHNAPSRYKLTEDGES